MTHVDGSSRLRQISPPIPGFDFIPHLRPRGPHPQPLALENSTATDRMADRKTLQAKQAGQKQRGGGLDSRNATFEATQIECSKIRAFHEYVRTLYRYFNSLLMRVSPMQA
jgi:hypothetical protein